MWCRSRLYAYRGRSSRKGFLDLMASLCLVRVYYTSLCMFAFISHPIVYCFLLLVNVGSVSGFLYLCFGFSWYIVLFCLVYVGGVYVLFIFISVFIPNTSPQSGERLFLFLILLFFFFFLTG